MTLLDVTQAIAGRNVSDTGGVLESAADRRQVVMWSRFEKPEEVGEVVLRFEDDGPLRVRDVARLELGREDVSLIAGTNGAPGMSLVVVKRSGADVIGTRARIAEALAQLELPPGVTVSIVKDMSYEMRNRMSVLFSNGLMGIVLVGAILFLFLAPSAAFWVAMGVPIVILGVIAMMPMTGMTINFVSTTAFVIVLGMLVDDAVVVAEMILVKRQEGLSPVEAAVQGTLAVASPVIASAATTVLAFAPLLAIGGMPSRVIWQIPAVVCLSLSISLAESFIILPGPHVDDARRRPAGSQARVRAPARGALSARPARHARPPWPRDRGLRRGLPGDRGRHRSPARVRVLSPGLGAGLRGQGHAAAGHADRAHRSGDQRHPGAAPADHGHGSARDDDPCRATRTGRARAASTARPRTRA